MLSFLTAETGYRRHLAPGVPAAELCARRGFPEAALRLPPAGAIDGPPLYAHVNHGRWVVECDDDACHDAQFASETDPRFFCVHCYNVRSGGQWRPVVWAGNPGQVERDLADLPEPHRNWYPSDSQGRPLGTPPPWGIALARAAHRARGGGR
jgi:hypothetical protein